jgi:hypothetical protein
MLLPFISAILLSCTLQEPTALVTDGLAPPLSTEPPPSIFPNAPSTSDGWVLADDCAMTEMPAIQPARNSCGQQGWAGQMNTTLAATEEFNGTTFKFLRIVFPSLRNSRSGNYGGAAPSRFSLTDILPQNTGYIYVGHYRRWATNWWHPMNAGHKSIFLIEKDKTTYHFFGWVDNPGNQAGRLLFKFGTQWGGNAGRPYADAVWTDQNASHAMSKGTWHLVEVLITPNSPGAQDGRLKAWVDGTVVLDAQNVPYFRPTATREWSGLWFDPIFAGNGAMPPADQYYDLSHTRVLVK